MFVRCVGGFVAEGSAGRDDAEGSAVFFHGADLDGGGLGSQYEAAVFLFVFVGDEEGVLHVARGVVSRDVESFEVVVFGFYFGAVHDGEAHVGEDVFDFELGLSQWVDVSGWVFFTRVCYVEEFGF